MELLGITPLLLTYNEEANLERTLSCLGWASQIVVVDSGSSDRTVEIAGRFPQVRLVKRQFDNHTCQWNFGLEQIKTQWVLALDADYQCPDGMAAELEQLPDDSNVLYQATFRYLVFGKPLRGSLYPPRAVLFSPCRYRYVGDGHTQLLNTAGATLYQLNSVIDHDDRKPIARWFRSQIAYAELEADKLSNSRPEELDWKDRLRRRIVFAAPLTLVYCLFVRRLIFNGQAGLYYTLQRTLAELMLGLTLLDRKLRAART